ncbi:hypothetical protein BVRB_4g090740 [Beta vulgaris subsp. vulgaris]|nr:hypothetical protein BVRB_4g090740 [Beta vulgaris subsp. vulgaris]
MDQKKDEPKPMRRKSSLLNLSMEEAQKQAEAQVNSGQSGSPTSPLKKSSSTRTNCLCSPTTHVGSFRCRLHRHGTKPGFRRGHSVGSDLSDLANKFSSKSNSSSSSLQIMH